MKSFKKLNVTLVYNLRKKIKELKQSEEKFKNIFENVNDEIIYLDSAGKILAVNQRSKEIYGYEPKEIIGKNFMRAGFISHQNVPKLLRLFRERMASDKATTLIELEVKHKDGRIIPVEVSTRMLNAGSRTKGILCIVRDISERKKAEEKLRESEEKYKTIVENATDQIFMLDTKLRFISVNAAAASMSHHTPEELIGKSILDIFPKETVARFAKNNKEVIETGKSKFIEEKMVVNGKEFYNNTILNPIKDSKGNVVAVMGIVRDVTEKERAEEKIKESEELLHAMFNKISDGLLIADVQNRKFVYANLQICKITGYAENELLRLSVKDIHLKKDLPYILKQFKRMAKGEISVVRDIPVARKDKTIVHCDISSRIINVNGRKCMAGIFRDVTKIAKKERKNHQK